MRRAARTLQQFADGGARVGLRRGLRRRLTRLRPLRRLLARGGGGARQRLSSNLFRERVRPAIAFEEAAERERVDGAQRLLSGQAADGEELAQAHRRVDAREDERLRREQPDAAVGLLLRAFGGRDRLVLVGQPQRDRLVREDARGLGEEVRRVERRAVAAREAARKPHARVEAPLAFGPAQQLAQNLRRLPPLKPLQLRRAEQARADERHGGVLVGHPLADDFAQARGLDRAAAAQKLDEAQGPQVRQRGDRLPRVEVDGGLRALAREAQRARQTHVRDFVYEFG